MPSLSKTGLPQNLEGHSQILVCRFIFFPKTNEPLMRRSHYFAMAVIGALRRMTTSFRWLCNAVIVFNYTRLGVLPFIYSKWFVERGGL